MTTDKGPQHFMVGFVGGLTIGLLVGWLYLSGGSAGAKPRPHCSPACVERVKGKIRKRLHHRHVLEARHARYRAAKERAGMATAVASWYEDAGGTACGTHYRDGVAHKTLPCGTFVRMCAVRCVTATVQDRGPFIAGREFDLNPGLKADIGCGDICTVRWAVVTEHPPTGR
jgi:hypothetical protein